MFQDFDLEAVFAARRAEFGNARMDMSEMAGEGGGEAAPVESSEGSQGESTGNPSWQEILNVIPDSLHGTVTPALQKWDQGVQGLVQKVHSEYEPYKPFKEAGYDPELLQYGLSVLEKLEQDPKAIYDALAEQYGWATPEQGQSETTETADTYDGEDLPEDPRIQRAEEMSQAVAEYILQQHEAQTEAEADADLDAEMASLAEEHGEYDEKYVMGLMLTGVSAEDAVKQYHEMVDNIRSTPRPNDSAPVVMGSGGGLPSGAVNVSSLDEQSRQKLVADILRQAAQQQ